MQTYNATYVGSRSATFRSVYFPLAIRTLKNLRTSLQWAWLDTVCRYRRSKIGPLWETINMLVMMLGLSVVSSALFGGNIAAQMGYIGLGMIIWATINSLISEGSSTFVGNAGLITSSSLSIDLYVGRTVFKTLITFCHHIALYFLGLALLLVPLTWTSLLAIPGLILLFVNGYWIVTAVAFMCARFRDLEQIIRNLLQLTFFVTPIFWNPEVVGNRKRFIIDYNILYYFIDIIRGPLLGRIPPLKYYIIVLAFTAAGYVLAFLVYRRWRRSLAFFV
jgi:ABC-type polysaccharide/polyol phosphate export permease